MSGVEAGHDDSNRVPHSASEFDVSLPMPDVHGGDTARARLRRSIGGVVSPLLLCVFA